MTKEQVKVTVGRAIVRTIWTLIFITVKLVYADTIPWKLVMLPWITLAFEFAISCLGIMMTKVTGHE